MEMIKERRKSYSWIVVALVLIFIFSVIITRKYFNLQKRYYKLMQEHYAPEIVLEK